MIKSPLRLPLIFLLLISVSGCNRYLGMTSVQNIYVPNNRGCQIVGELAIEPAANGDRKTTIAFYPSTRCDSAVYAYTLKEKHYLGYAALYELPMFKLWLVAPLSIPVTIVEAIAEKDITHLRKNIIGDLVDRIIGGSGIDSYADEPPPYAKRLWDWTAWLNPFVAHGSIPFPKRIMDKVLIRRDLNPTDFNELTQIDSAKILDPGGGTDVRGWGGILSWPEFKNPDSWVVLQGRYCTVHLPASEVERAFQTGNPVVLTDGQYSINFQFEIPFLHAPYEIDSL
ncbi:hypothetical protein BH09SUM1_BH09SUM1_12470 [soil metagenome]